MYSFLDRIRWISLKLKQNKRATKNVHQFVYFSHIYTGNRDHIAYNLLLFCSRISGLTPQYWMDNGWRIWNCAYLFHMSGTWICEVWCILRDRNESRDKSNSNCSSSVLHYETVISAVKCGVNWSVQIVKCARAHTLTCRTWKKEKRQRV